MCLLQYVREVSDPLGQPAAVRLGLRACRSQTIRSLYKLYLYNVPRELPVPGRQRGGEWGRSRAERVRAERQPSDVCGNESCASDLCDADVHLTGCFRIPFVSADHATPEKENNLIIESEFDQSIRYFFDATSDDSFRRDVARSPRGAPPVPVPPRAAFACAFAGRRASSRVPPSVLTSVTTYGTSSPSPPPGRASPPRRANGHAMYMQQGGKRSLQARTRKNRHIGVAGRESPFPLLPTS